MIFYFVFCKVGQTGRSRRACRDVVLTCLCIHFSKSAQQCVTVPWDRYCICHLFRFTLFQLVVITLIIIGGVSTGVYRACSRLSTCFILVQERIVLEIIEVICGRRYEIGICTDHFWLAIFFLFFIFVAVELHLSFVILVGIDVCLKECIRIFYFFCNAVFQAHIIEKTHRVCLVYSHVAVFVDLVISERDQACRDLNCDKISHMQLIVTCSLFDCYHDIFEVSFRIYMVRIRDDIVKCIFYCRFIACCCLCPAVALSLGCKHLICIQQCVHIIDLHIVTQLIGKGDIAALVRVFSLLHMSRRLG